MRGLCAGASVGSPGQTSSFITDTPAAGRSREQVQTWAESRADGEPRCSQISRTGGGVQIIHLCSTL